MNDPLRYQSPIDLNYTNSLDVSQLVEIKGKNKKAKYIPENKIFLVQDKVILTLNEISYQLIEYHFHMPGEHEIKGKKYPAELHYVFYKINDKKENKKDDNKENNRKDDKKEDNCYDVCGGKNIPQEENILVIGRVIKNDLCREIDLTELRVDLPSKYFEYDGSLTGPGDGATAVRWVFGNNYIKLPLKEIKPIAKGSRSIKPLDNRIILTGNFSDCC